MTDETVDYYYSEAQPTAYTVKGPVSLTKKSKVELEPEFEIDSDDMHQTASHHTNINTMDNSNNHGDTITYEQSNSNEHSHTSDNSFSD